MTPQPVMDPIESALSLIPTWPHSLWWFLSNQHYLWSLRDLTVCVGSYLTNSISYLYVNLTSCDGSYRTSTISDSYVNLTYCGGSYRTSSILTLKRISQPLTVLVKMVLHYVKMESNVSHNFISQSMYKHCTMLRHSLKSFPVPDRYPTYWPPELLGIRTKQFG